MISLGRQPICWGNDSHVLKFKLIIAKIPAIASDIVCRNTLHTGMYESVRV